MNASDSKVKFDFVYVDQENFDELTGETSRSLNALASFKDLVSTFSEYKD